jgi:hypothetical protein
MKTIFITGVSSGLGSAFAAEHSPLDTASWEPCASSTTPNRSHHSHLTVPMLAC